MKMLPAIRSVLRRYPLRFRALAMLAVLLVVAGGMPRWVVHAVDARHETLSTQSIAWDADEPHREGDGDAADTHICLHSHYFAAQPCALPDTLTVHVLALVGSVPFDTQPDAPDTLATPPQRPPIA